MKRAMMSAAVLLATCLAGAAGPIVLEGDAADKFIAEHFPNADIPGPVSGAFTITDRSGRSRKGHAQCDVPAMGARSDGAVSTCSLRY